MAAMVLSKEVSEESSKKSHCSTSHHLSTGNAGSASLQFAGPSFLGVTGNLLVQSGYAGNSTTATGGNAGKKLDQDDPDGQSLTILPTYSSSKHRRHYTWIILC